MRDLIDGEELKKETAKLLALVSFRINLLDELETGTDEMYWSPETEKLKDFASYLENFIE